MKIDKYYQYEESDPQQMKKSSPFYYFKYAIGLTFIFAIILLIPAVTSSYPQYSAFFAFKSSVDRIESLNVTIKIVNNDYPFELRSISQNLLPWSFLIQPYKTHTASVSRLVVDGVEKPLDDYKLSWNFGSLSLHGNSVALEINDLGVVKSSVTFEPRLGKSRDNSETYTYNFDVMVKYVRREIRNLTDTDRVTFFDTLYKLYTVSDTDGKAAYGSKFHSMEYFLMKHLAGAGPIDCDHWHDGAGILTHHTAYTLEVEQALQAINPSVSMPYWEYGMDYQLYSDWTTSPIFNDDWFGEANPSSDDHSITKGIWKDIELPDGSAYKNWDIVNTGSLNPFVNGYGKLRSPWNNNPSPKIGRHNQTYSYQTFSNPTCTTLYDCFVNSDLGNINYCINGDTHGPVHVLIGGVWELNNTVDTDYCETESSTNTIARLPFFKKTWRMGYTRCPTTCPTDGSPCSCEVPESYIERFGAEAILEDIGHNMSGSSQEKMYNCLKEIGHPGIAGEMFSSAAAFDPTFWPLHGSLEKLLGRKRILAAQGLVSFNESWSYPTIDDDSPAVFLQGVCDWSNVAGSDDLTLPSCDMGITCHGHAADDVIEFGDFQNKGEKYTNLEFYEFLHPWNADLPYTYDSFDYDYCADEGYTFAI